MNVTNRSFIGLTFLLIALAVFIAQSGGGAGTVTGVTGTAPITSSGGAAPVIALDLLTTGADGDSIIATSDSFLEVVDSSLTMLRGCADAELPKWVEATDTWDCSADNAGGGSAIILDLGDDDVHESIDLGEIATTGDTNSIFTESAADKLLINLALNWPSSDTATVLAADPTDCGANTFADAIDASGNLTCNVVTTLDILDDTILEIDLDSVDAPADEECLTFESGVGGDFEWQVCGDPDQNLFETINAESGTDPIADSPTDTLNFTGTGGLIVTGTVGTDTIDFSWDTTADDVISVTNLDDVDAPADEECATFEAGTSNIEWQACGAGGGNASWMTFKDTDRYYSSALNSQITTSAGVVDFMYSFPYYAGVAVTINSIGIEVVGAQAATCNARLGLYDDDGTIAPGALLLDAGEIATDSTGIKTIAISQALSADTLYWMVIHFECSAGTLRTSQTYACWAVAGSTLATSPGLGWQRDVGSFGALPDPFGASTVSTGPCYSVGVRF